MLKFLQILKYKDLYAKLGIHSESIRELEELIIDSIYSVIFLDYKRMELRKPWPFQLYYAMKGLISGRLNQKTQSLHIFDSMSRDVRPTDLAAIITKLMKW